MGILDVPSPNRTQLYLNVRDYGGRGDRQIISGVSIASGSPTVTISGLTSADVGKLIVIPGAAGNNAGTGQPDSLAASVTSVTGSTATISATAVTSVTGGTAHVGTNNTNAIAAMQAAAPATGATFFFPRGGYMYSGQIAPRNYTTWLGEGRDATTFLPVSTTHGFYRMGNSVSPYGPTPTPDDPVLGVQWRDLTVDGAIATGQMKGWYLNHLQGCVWERTGCKNTGASGYGVDYLRDTWFLHAIVENAGRAGTTSSAGFSGFGIGSGAFATENVYFIGCVARANKRFGLFIENQATSTQSVGAQVIGGLFTGNQWGISDNGCDSLLVSGAHIKDNVADGFKLTTTSLIHQVGINGKVVNCTITGNGGDGVQLDWTQTGSATYGRYRIANNDISNNVGYGIRSRHNATDAVPEVHLTDNNVTRNGLTGILIAGASTTTSLLTRSEIARNRAFGNGTLATTGQTYGIHLSCSLTSVNVQDNYCTDPAATGKVQTDGIFVATGITLTGGCVTNNDVRGNGTGTLTNLGSATISATTPVERNRGYNPIGMLPVTVGGSPFTYTAGASRETLYVIGGTFSSITLAGVTIYNSGANAGTLTIELDPGISAVFTYSVVPVAIKTYKH